MTVPRRAWVLLFGCAPLSACLLEAVDDEAIGSLPPPCAIGWVVSSDGMRCLRPGFIEDGGVFDAGEIEDAGRDPVCFDPESGVESPDAFFPDQPVINEYLFGHAEFNGLNNHYYEFIEVYGPPNADLRDLTLVDVNSNRGGNLGLIEAIVPVERTNRAGFWRSCLGWMDEVNAFNQASGTLFLVRGFTSSVGADLDVDDDGRIDGTPWAEVVDEVSFQDGAATTDMFYAQPILTNDGFPGHPIMAARQLASRALDGVDTEAEEDWRKSAFGGFGLPDVQGRPRSTEAWVTPGAPNLIQP